MNIEKLSSAAAKLGNFFRAVRKIIFIVCIVMVAALAILSVVNLVNPNAVIGEGLNSVDLGPVTFVLNPSHTPTNGSILGYAWVYALLALVSAAVIYTALGYICKILEPMAQGLPFRNDISLHVKKLGYSCLALGIAQNIGRIVETISAMRVFGLERLADSSYLQSITYNIEIELGFILVFFILLLMSRVFEYGAELQKLSDETV